MFLFRPWSQVKPRTRVQLVLAAVLAFGLSLGVPLLAVHTERLNAARLDPANAQRTYDADFDAAQFPGITIFASVINVDLSTMSYKLRFSVTPGGSLVRSQQGDLIRPSQPITIVFDNQVIQFPAGQVIRRQDALLFIDSGDINRYPFDSYDVSFVVSASATDPQTNQTTPLPIQLAVMMSATSWQADTRFNQQVSPTIEAKIVFQRYWPSRFFSIFVFCIQWILSVIALILSTTLWFRNRKVEPPTIGVIASLLFALPAIRSAQPGAPPVGCTLDVAGYFWNLGLAALSMMLLMINYIVRYTREKRRATLSSMRAARAARARAETVAGDVSDMESGAEESDFDGSLSGVSDVETLDSPVEKGPPAQLEKVEVHVPDVSSLPPALRRSARRNSQAVLERRTEQHVRFA